MNLDFVFSLVAAFCYRDALLLVQLIGGAMLFWSSFCRLTLTSTETIQSIRLAIWFQSVAALFVVAAPYLPLADAAVGWPPFTTPNEIWVFVVATSAAMQIVTSMHWVNGVPHSYIKPEHRPMRRRRTDEFTSTLV